MPRDSSHILLHWTQEGKAGIEPSKHVPEDARFVGAITSAMFSGNKRWYPAKVVMISDNLEELETRAEELASQLLKDKEVADAAKPSGKSTKRNAPRRTSPSRATKRSIAQALGQRVPVPKVLKPEKRAALISRKTSSVRRSQGQSLLDQEVSFRLLQKSKGNTNVANVSLCDEDTIANLNGSYNSNHGVASSKDASTEWCSCPYSSLLHKHCNSATLSFIRDLSAVLNRGPEDSKQYLQLKPIPDGVKAVELTQGLGVFISQLDKDALKVDYNNKCSSLIRETLYVLYGIEAFRTSTVTARGNRLGTYGIEDKVLKAVWGFVNRHIKSKIMLKTLVATINKRAPEWRKGICEDSTKNKKTRKRSNKENYFKDVSAAEDEEVELSPERQRRGGSSHPPTQLHATSTPLRSATPRHTPSTPCGGTPRRAPTVRSHTPHGAAPSAAPYGTPYGHPHGAYAAPYAPYDPYYGTSTPHSGAYGGPHHAPQHAAQGPPHPHGGFQYASQGPPHPQGGFQSEGHSQWQQQHDQNLTPL